MSKKSLSYYISYGLVGGPLRARRLIRLLQEAGYVPSTVPQKADMIIAHSAGCWLIPEGCTPRLVVYAGMPLAQTKPGKAWFRANRQMLKDGALSTLRNNVKTTYYAVRQPKRNLSIIRMAKSAEPVLFAGTPTVFITNRDDPWPAADKLDDYISRQSWSFIGLSGTHDDIWGNPQRYVDIINHYARLLA